MQAERPTELLPCPFCGGAASVHWGPTCRFVGIECDSCAAFGGEITGIPIDADRAPYIKRAIEKWNTRTLDAAPSEPSAEHWRAALYEAREFQEWITTQQAEWIEQRARAIAREGK